MSIPVEDKTAESGEVRCPACNAIMQVRPVVISGDEAARWTGGIEVKHAPPSCEWSKSPANVGAWLHATLGAALLRDPS